ncbi:unnamed protein product, partial [Polarella glacialis]
VLKVKALLFTAARLGEFPQAFQGDPSCWGFGLTFEKCCWPTPRKECWDDVFTSERCCGSLASLAVSEGVPRVVARLRDELFTDVDPYSFLRSDCGRGYLPQVRYPDSHLTPDVIRAVLSFLGVPPLLWVE